MPKALNELKTCNDCAVIVAHPDDETLWAGGIILMNPQIKWTVITLCRKSDPDRAPRFFNALAELRAAGAMGDLDDGPDQNPLDQRQIQSAILDLLPSGRFDLIITHGQRGEYTRHLRHEETASAVTTLWKERKLSSNRLWTFAYSDNNGAQLPHPVKNAQLFVNLPNKVWQKKYNIITNIYGFSTDSFEARVTPKDEAFMYIEKEKPLI
jgi:LmbE family N-acetylglucosaminyl deacetylase